MGSDAAEGKKEHQPNYLHCGMLSLSLFCFFLFDGDVFICVSFLFFLFSCFFFPFFFAVPEKSELFCDRRSQQNCGTIGKCTFITNLSSSSSLLSLSLSLSFFLFDRDVLFIPFSFFFFLFPFAVPEKSELFCDRRSRQNCGINR